MKNIKKLLSVVLSLCMVASMVVLPVTAQAADGDVLEKYTFDGSTTTDLFGTTGSETYQIVSGNSTVNGVALGLAADDNVVLLGKGYGAGTTGRGSSNANTAEGSLSFGNSKGDTFEGVKHATIQFDYLTTHAYESLYIYPNSGTTNRVGIGTIRTTANGSDQNVDIGIRQNSWTDVASGNPFPRREWHEIALEYDMNQGTATVYIDGTEVKSISGLDTTLDVPADFQICATESYNAMVLNNFYVYEGAYDETAVADPKYVDYTHKYVFDDDVTTNLWNANSSAYGSWSVVEGTVTGDDASDKVLQLSRLDNSGAFVVRTSTYSGTIDADTVTASVNVYQPSSGNAADMTLTYYANAASDADGINGSITLGDDGVWTLAYRANDTATTIATTAADATQLDKWHELAITMTKATSAGNDGTIKYYIDGTLMYTQTGLAITSFTKDIRANSEYGNFNGSVHYIDDYFLYGDEYLNWNGTEYEEPTEAPTEAPTPEPTEAPTDAPTDAPTEAPEEDWYFTFDDDNGASGIFGSAGTYELVAGNSTENGFQLGLEAADMVAKVYTGSAGVKDSATFFNGKEWGDVTTWTKATFQYDAFLTNTWLTMNVLPTAKNRYGSAFKTTSGTLNMLCYENGWTEYDTGLDYTRANGNWVEIAIEFDIPNDTVKTYVDGEVVRTVTSAGLSGTTPADWQITGNTAGGGYCYINNVYYYEGGYENSPADPTYEPEATPEPTPTPGPTDCPKTILNEYYFNESDDTPWAGELYDGTVAGKVATDKVYRVTDGETYFPGGSWGDKSPYAQATLQFDVYMTNDWHEMAIWPSYGGNGGTNKVAFQIESQQGTSQSVGLIEGNGSVTSTAFDTSVAKGAWHQFAIEYDTLNSLATLYMDGVAVDTLTMTGWTSAPADLKISCNTLSSDIKDEEGNVTGQKNYYIYLDNIIWSSGLYNNWEAPEAPVTDVDFAVLATGEKYTRDGVDYVFMAVTTGLISDMSLYDMFVCTDGVDTKGIAISELAGTTITGAAEIGVLVLNVPFANKDNFKAKLTVAE